ncbi:NADP-dependent oxidoreductase domain-containing protein [Coemansia spiralis]|nr:NADP-dependent oxidoreductase domain-containing protein [Coemansia spiralis]
MGGHGYSGWWGNMGGPKHRGIVTYQLSPYEMKTNAHLISKGTHNFFRRTSSQLGYILPGIFLFWAVTHFGKKKHEWVNSKAGHEAQHGTWQQRDTSTVKAVVCQALNVGYRLIDTASAYRNEVAIGSALAGVFADSASGLRREDIWITSKLAPKQQGFDRATAAVHESLRDLQTDYIDLYLIHWPGASGKPPESAKNRKFREGSWHALELLYRQGKVRAIGVSNYTRMHLEEMKEYAKIMPMVNQCELHPLCPQTELLHYCQSNNIVFTAYASLGEAELLNGNLSLAQLDTIVARRQDLTKAQVLLLWGLQHGAAVIPKASSVHRLQENVAVLRKGLLSDDDMCDLDSVDVQKHRHICWDPEKVA